MSGHCYKRALSHQALEPAMRDHPYGRQTCYGRPPTGPPKSAFPLKPLCSAMEDHLL